MVKASVLRKGLVYYALDKASSDKIEGTESDAAAVEHLFFSHFFWGRTALDADFLKLRAKLSSNAASAKSGATASAS